jgi:hypothetical protein
LLSIWWNTRSITSWSLRSWTAVIDSVIAKPLFLLFLAKL